MLQAPYSSPGGAIIGNQKAPKRGRSGVSWGISSDIRQRAILNAIVGGMERARQPGALKTLARVACYGNLKHGRDQNYKIPPFARLGRAFVRR